MAPTALQILEISNDSFKIHKANFNSVLKKVGPRPFVLYSINGATRTGKSYALNYFIRYLEAKGQNVADWLNFDPSGKFVWKSGKERTTVGINLWSEPYIVKDSGREVAILLMDTQGLFDEQTTARQNAIIFSLSALCSSVSIFNLMKNIDENVLQQLQFFSGYAHLVSVPDSAENEMDDVEAFQKLIFLIRDFDFEEYEYGFHGMKTTVPRGKNNFCRDTFVRSEKTCAPENLHVRESILECYKEVGIFILPDPGKKFRRDPLLSPDEDFSENMTKFVEMMVSRGNLITKKIGGHEVTGLEFQKYVEAWTKLCDQADVHFPKVQTILEATVNIQATLARNTIRSFFNKEFDNFMDLHPAGVPTSQLRYQYETLEQNALILFDNMSNLCSAQIREETHEQLVEEFQQIFQTNQKLNAILQDKEAIRSEQMNQETVLRLMQDDLNQMSAESEELKNRTQLEIEKANVKLERLSQDKQNTERELKAKLDEMEIKTEMASKIQNQAQQMLKLKIAEGDFEIKKEKQLSLLKQKELEENLQRVEKKLEKMRMNKKSLFRGLERPIPKSSATHRGVECDGCGVCPIIGIRFKCRKCPDEDFCESCEAKGTHSHHFLRKTLDSGYSSTLWFCDPCGVQLMGNGYLCKICPGYSLCSYCHSRGEHANHESSMTINSF